MSKVNHPGKLQDHLSRRHRYDHLRRAAGRTAPPVFLRWPYQPSVTTPDRLPAVANAVMGVLAEAIAKLGQLRAGER